MKKNLKDSLVSVGENSIKVYHEYSLVMIDGKVCNTITDTRIDTIIVREVNTVTLEFELSILYGWIRFLEYLLHLSYKIPIKKWQAMSDDYKKIVGETKSRIQKEFRERSGLIGDQPNPGSAHFNDRNTARRFFKYQQK